MLHSQRRRVERVNLAQPLLARLGATPVVLVDISVFGARIEHSIPIATAASASLVFRWHDHEIALECRVTRSRLEHVATGSEGVTVYHSGLEFGEIEASKRAALKEMLSAFITRALEEQKLNAYGVIPEHTADAMPVFQKGQLAATVEDKANSARAPLPIMKIARGERYIRCTLERGFVWRQKRTSDPAQPDEGFTISAKEPAQQVEMLCEAYQKSDAEGRRLIRLFSELSIIEGGGIPPGRFEP